MTGQELYIDEYTVDLPTCYEEGIVPEGRGIPMDLSKTDADCGPSSLAAYLNISAAEAIELLPLWKEKRRHSSRRTLDALAVVGKPHQRINLPQGIKLISEINMEYPSGFGEIRFLKENGSEFSVRHIVAYDNNKFGELRIYDNNARVDGIQGSWVSETHWLYCIHIFSPEKAIDHYFRHILVPSDK